MTARITPIADSKSLTDELSNQVLVATQNSVFMCTLSMEYLTRLRALFGGIVAASSGDSVSQELAKLGLFLVDDFDNSMDCYQEEYQNRLDELSQEVNHG